MNEITINGQELPIREYNGVRVVTFKDIDRVHERPEGTARRNFNKNKEHFIEGEDYFRVCADEIRTHKIMELSPKTHEDVILIAESGYLMLVKSFTDDRSWDVQRTLTNCYFKVQEIVQQLSPIEMIASIANNAVEIERRQKALEAQSMEQQKAIENVSRQLDDMRDVISLDKNSWRRDAKNIIVKIAQAMGGTDYIKDVNNEIYDLIDQRAGVQLGTRLTNMRRRMADEGACKSKRDRKNKLDVIGEEKKLIEIYVAIVKEMAIKYGVGINGGETDDTENY